MGGRMTRRGWIIHGGGVVGRVGRGVSRGDDGGSGGDGHERVRVASRKGRMLRGWLHGLLQGGGKDGWERDSAMRVVLRRAVPMRTDPASIGLMKRLQTVGCESDGGLAGLEGGRAQQRLDKCGREHKEGSGRWTE